MTGVLISAVQEASCNVNDIHDDHGVKVAIKIGERKRVGLSKTCL